MTTDKSLTSSGNNANTLVICSCGSVIPEDDISYSNRCNEEGEEYYEVCAECSSCTKFWETSEWGECEDMQEAQQVLIRYIKDE